MSYKEILSIHNNGKDRISFYLYPYFLFSIIFNIVVNEKYKGERVKIVSFLISAMVVPTVILWAGDWDESDWGKETSNNDNSAFEKSKIKNRSKKEYDDKVYKYITGDYKVENNDIELANIYLDDSSKNDDIEINIITENLKVEGDSYRDSIDIKRNRYKNFVQNNERGVEFFQEDEDREHSELGNSIQSQDSRYNKVADEDVSELETVDIRGRDNIREVNVFMEDVNIIVD